MKIIISKTDDAEQNCRLEEDLLKTDEQIILFYINAPAVVIGRNQCAEAEADMDFCKKNNIKIVRRISGGGTVYHDEGNINYCFITNANPVLILDKEPLKPVIEMLKSFGINAVVGKRKEITVNGLKISGTASYSNGKREMFHGTLLHKTKLNMLNDALKGNEALRGKKIASVRSEVINLGCFKGVPPNTNDFLDDIICLFEKMYNVEREYK